MALILVAFTALSILLVASFFRPILFPDRFPAINRYSGDYMLKKAHVEYSSDAKKLVTDGVAKYNGPFRIITTLGSRIILPPRFADWVNRCKDLDHQAVVKDEYFADYPGFEGNGAIHDASRLLINVTKTKLAQSWQCAVFKEHISDVLEKEWTSNEDWHAVPWSPAVVARYIGRMSSAVFAGPELARDPDWQDLILAYTINLFNGIRALRTWPGFLRPVIHWVLPECVVCRQQLVRAKKIIDPVVQKRRKDRNAALAENREPEKHNDAIEWMEQEAATASSKGLSVSDYESAAAQLGLAIAAMHTTTELMNQVLVDICRSEKQQPDAKLIQELRDEVEAAVAESGWTTAGIFKMRLLDSVIKETQRLKPGSIVNLERKVMRDTRLPDGTVLLKGEVIAVDTSAMWDETVFPEPEKWDAWRFYNLRGGTEKGESSAQLVSSSMEHFAFGLGKSICPGRFMVAHEVKVAMAVILLEYDVRLAEGCDPKVFNYGFEMLADPSTMLDVRKRTWTRN